MMNCICPIRFISFEEVRYPTSELEWVAFRNPTDIFFRRYTTSAIVTLNVSSAIFYITLALLFFIVPSPQECYRQVSLVVSSIKVLHNSNLTFFKSLQKLNLICVYICTSKNCVVIRIKTKTGNLNY